MDATSVALLAVVLLAPFIPKLKAIELGGAKTQWQENAVAGISDIVRAMTLQHNALERLYQDSIVEAQSLEEAVPATEAEPQTVNLLPVEAGKYVEDAGLRMLRSIKNMDLHRALPILFYSSASAAENFGATLYAEGATTVTSSYRELFSALRSSENEALQFIVTSALSEMPNMTVQNSDHVDIDYLVTMPSGATLGIELGSWVTRPQMSAFADRVGRLVTARGAGMIDQAWLVVRDEVVDARRRAFAEEKDVRLVSPTALPGALSRAGN